MVCFKQKKKNTKGLINFNSNEALFFRKNLLNFYRNEINLLKKNYYFS